MEKRWGKAFLTLLILLSVIVQLFPETGYAEEYTARTIRVGYYTIPGFQEYDAKTETYSGYSYEYMLALAQYAHWEYEFVPVEFPEGVEMLKNGQLDLMNNVSQTEERKEFLSYSSSSSGYNCAYLVTNNYNLDVAYEDFERIGTLRVGLVGNSIYNQRFETFCQENEIAPYIRYYESNEDVVLALDRGEVDARILTSSQNIDSHVIAKFAPEEYYFAVPKDRKDILRELNRAMETIKSNDPEFQARLENKYYSSMAEKNTVLTPEEKQYIAENPIIDVVYDTDCYPLSYTDDEGQFAGTIAGIFQLISERTGLSFRFTGQKASYFANPDDEGEILMFAGLPYDYIWAQPYGIFLTPPFAELTVVEVRRDGFTGSQGTMAIVDSYYLGQICQEHYGANYTYQVYASTLECMDAVRKGEADIACITSYEAEAFQSKLSYRSMSYSMAQMLSYSISTGISMDADPRLSNIVIKGMNAISADEIDTLFRTTSVISQQPDALTTLTDHPEVMAPIFIIVSLLAVTVLFFMFYTVNMKKKNREIEEKNRQLAENVNVADQANEAKRKFLSNMSHEIRTPMNAIIGMTQLAKGVADNPETRNYLEEIDNASDYMLTMLNDVLDMSRIENNKFQLNPQWATMEDVYWPCIQMLEPEMKSKGIQFTYPITERINHFEVFVDVMRTKQIFMNLLNNAFKFTPEGGRVSLEIHNVTHNEHHAVDRIIVSDTGCGMSKAFLERIFEPFEQERNPYSDRIQGTGLGLALLKQIADEMGGDIQVESELGRGSRFTFTFPYEYRYVEEKREVEASVPVEYHLDGKRILLVDDQPLNRRIAEALLIKKGMLVEQAENGEIAIDKFKASDPGYYDAILMDIRMPVLDGLETTRRLRKLDRPDAKSVPIVAMTANAFESDVRLSLRAGMNAHLTKPIEPEKLFGTLATLINVEKS